MVNKSYLILSFGFDIINLQQFGRMGNQPTRFYDASDGTRNFISKEIWEKLSKNNLPLSLATAQYQHLLQNYSQNQNQTSDNFEAEFKEVLGSQLHSWREDEMDNPELDVDLDDEDEDIDDYYEITIIQEFYIMTEKGSVVTDIMFTNQKKIDVPGVGSFYIGTSTRYEKVVELLQEVRECHEKVKESSFGGSGAYGGGGGRNFKEKIVELKKKINKERKEVKKEKTVQKALTPRQVVKLSNEFEIIKRTIITVIRIPLSSMKKCKNKKNADKFIDAILSNLEITDKRRIGGVKVQTIVNKKNTALRSRCLAKGCSNTNVLHWYHIGGDKLASYRNDMPNWLVKYSTSGCVACTSCKKDHCLDTMQFACELHKDDFRGSK